MPDLTNDTVGRRRIIASLTALAGAVVAKLTNASRAEAASNSTVIGVSTAQYGLLASPGVGSPISPTLGSTNHGVIGANSALEVPLSSGVLGVRSGAAFAGVLGVNNTGRGVMGRSDSGNAVYGEIPATSNENTIAIYGLNSSTYGSSGAGGFGVYGFSARGHGLVGATAAAGAAAVVGASNGVAGAYAAAFYGPVAVAGDFTVFGGAKSAAVSDRDGTLRRLYCVESPESWFEDFGSGELVEGRAEVAIEPGFASVAAMGDYHVFLTGYDNDNVLHVTERTPQGFTVEANAALAALQGRARCDLGGKFSWRVVARRKDIVGERFAKVTTPAAPALPPS